MQARHTELKITYENKDISTDISPYILSFSFTDNASDKADDLTLTLEDRDGLWFTDYAPSKGDKITCAIILHEGENSESLPCGSFSVDQIEYSMPPRVLSIKGVSASITKSMRTENHNRAWENVSLKTICSDLASGNSLGLFYEGEDFEIERVEQASKPDIEFLSSLCKDYGMNLKVRDEKLIVYSQEENEESESVAELDISDKKILTCKFVSKSAEVYRKARVKYHNSVKDELYEGEYEDEDEEGSERVLEVREYVSSSGDAQRLAEKKLKAANKTEVTGNITLMGDIRFSGGQNITLSSFGIFSGKFTITKATHKIDSSGYTTSLELGQTQNTKKQIQNHKKKRTGKKSSGSSELFYEGTKYYGYKGD